MINCWRKRRRSWLSNLWSNNKARAWVAALLAMPVPADPMPMARNLWGETRAHRTCSGGSRSKVGRRRGVWNRPMMRIIKKCRRVVRCRHSVAQRSAIIVILKMPRVRTLVVINRSTMHPHTPQGPTKIMIMRASKEPIPANSARKRRETPRKKRQKWVSIWINSSSNRNRSNWIKRSKLIWATMTATISMSGAWWHLFQVQGKRGWIKLESNKSQTRKCWKSPTPLIRTRTTAHSSEWKVIFQTWPKFRRRRRRKGGSLWMWSARIIPRIGRTIIRRPGRIRRMLARRNWKNSSCLTLLLSNRRMTQSHKFQ